MGKIILVPLEEDDPVFSRGPVNYNPASIHAALNARIASKDKAPTSTPEKAQEGGEDE